MISTALLNSDGTQKVTWDVRDLAIPGDAVIASEGLRRATRETHERRATRYTLQALGASEDDLAAVRQLLEDTRYGADWCRWRHPKDDPIGDAASAPFYRLVDQDVAFDREASGQAASVSITLERIGLT